MSTSGLPPRPQSFRDVAAFQRHLASVDRNPWHGQSIRLPIEVTSGYDSPLSQPIAVDGLTIGNRFALAAMEGWDGTANGDTFGPGHPTHLTVRRWQHMGLSGAKLILGGEAFAVQPDGRANPNQLCWTDQSPTDLEVLLRALHHAHEACYGTTENFLCGLQLTDSGRFRCPNAIGVKEPRVMHLHPVLDRFANPAPPLWTDDELDALPDRYVQVAKAAWDAGAAIVDVKACHGYLGHEALAAKTRPGRYGGSFENRTRLFCKCVQAIRAEASGLIIMVRFSAWDVPPRTTDGFTYKFSDYHFGVNDGGDIDLTEPIAFVKLCERLGVKLIFPSAGSPYYSANWQRPAYKEAVDATAHEVDPMAALMLHVRTAEVLKQAVPGLAVVVSGLSAAHKYLPHLAEWIVGDNLADFISVGRMLLAYPEFPAHVLAGCVDESHLCVACSKCTNVVRSGCPGSGCLTRDDAYHALPQHAAYRKK